MNRKVMITKNDSIAQNSAKSYIIDVSRLPFQPLWNDTGAAVVVPVCVQFSHTGGTITVTLFWTIDGRVWTQQAFAGVGDVAGVTAATGTGWDIALLPALPSQLKITITEDNAAACTDISADLVM